jgi:hypothetical protein
MVDSRFCRRSICTVTLLNNDLLVFIFYASAAQRWLWPRSRGFVVTHNDAQQSVGLLWTSDQLVAETSTWQHTQQTNIHAPGGIRTHDRSRRAAVDLRLRPRGHCDRQIILCGSHYCLLVLSFSSSFSFSLKKTFVCYQIWNIRIF